MPTHLRPGTEGTIRAHPSVRDAILWIVRIVGAALCLALVGLGVEGVDEGPVDLEDAEGEAG